MTSDWMVGGGLPWVSIVEVVVNGIRRYFAVESVANDQDKVIGFSGRFLCDDKSEIRKQLPLLGLPNDEDDDATFDLDRLGSRVSQRLSVGDANELLGAWNTIDDFATATRRPFRFSGEVARELRDTLFLFGFGRDEEDVARLQIRKVERKKLVQVVIACRRRVLDELAAQGCAAPISEPGL